MLRQSPYLQRRGYGLSFRIAVPVDLRHVVGCREITRAFSTADKRQAVPMALEFAATAKRLFCDLRATMAASDSDNEGDLAQKREVALAMLKAARHKLEVSILKEDHSDVLVDLQIQHRREMELLRLRTENEAFKFALSNQATVRPLDPEPAPSAPSSSSAENPPPTLGEVVQDFLEGYQKAKKPAMYKKHVPVLNMLLAVIGDKPVNQLKQRDLNNFFDLLGHLPPRWNDECRKRRITVQELGLLEHEETLGPKTFKETYIGCIRPFLTKSRLTWGDQGFPLGLTTDGIEYSGERIEGESKQRSLKIGELRRLFEGEEMKAFAADRNFAAHFWLPHVALFTGARLNELCQINPQTDILLDEESGVTHFWITTETDGDERIRKSVKTGDARKVPVHKKLIELGFLKYVDHVKTAGAKLLFPEWKPINLRASGEAEKWFRQFLRDTGLRDETPKACILGMHAFRHTLLTHGASQDPPLSLFGITGHEQEALPIAASGAGRGYLSVELLSPLKDKAATLNQLAYAVSFNTPVVPT